MLHSTSLLGLLKEFQGQNLQNFVPSASAYAFGWSPIFLKCELRLWPNVKNTALVIHWFPLLRSFIEQFFSCFLECLAGQMEINSLSTVPMYFVSPVANSSLAYSNIMAEWLSGTVYIFQECHKKMLKTSNLVISSNKVIE